MDLPWWVFGIRYLTGYDQTIETKKELVILLKMELLPTLQERFENPQWDNVLHKALNDGDNQIKYYKFNEGEDANP
jgi:type IV pilus assembly protein PilQ